MCFGVRQSLASYESEQMVVEEHVFGYRFKQELGIGH